MADGGKPRAMHRDGVIEKLIARITPKVHAFNLFGFDNEHDRPSSKYQSLFAPPEGETGWDRLNRMITVDDFGERSPELKFIMDGATTALFTGTCIGILIGSRHGYLSFMEKNQATSFYGQMDARRKLQDKVLLDSLRYAFRWGWRLTLFTTLYLGTATTFSVYRGKSSILDYIFGGALSGSLYKLKSGPKATFAGGIIGAAFGVVAGSVTLALLWATGNTMEEVRFWRYNYQVERKSELTHKYREKRKEAMTPLLRSHDSQVTDVEVDPSTS